jgi:hypothetical protein
MYLPASGLSRTRLRGRRELADHSVGRSEGGQNAGTSAVAAGLGGAAGVAERAAAVAGPHFQRYLSEKWGCRGS